MSTELEQRLRDHYAQIADELQLPSTTFDDLIAGRNIHPARAEHSARAARRRTSGRWGLAVATLVVVVAGLAAIAGRLTGKENDAAVEPASDAPPTLLSDAADVRPSEWVIAAALPDDLVWMYATHVTDSPPAVPDRVSRYGTTSLAGTFERLSVSLGGTAEASRDGEPLEIAGTTWTLDTSEPGRWTAYRALESTVLVVHDSLPFDQVDRDMIAGLVVVPESGLPSPALGNADRLVEAARYELNGTTYTLAVQESNGYWCIELDGSGGCGRTFDPSSAITIDAGVSTVADGADTGVIVQAGTTTAETARVEVEFSDGTVVVVVPSDLSSLSGRSFWVAAAEVPVDSRSVREVRAYDTEGRLLASQAPL